MGNEMGISLVGNRKLMWCRQVEACRKEIGCAQVVEYDYGQT